MHACFINTQVPHEVKNQRASAKRTSQIMQIGQDVNIQMIWEVVLSALESTYPASCMTPASVN